MSLEDTLYPLLRIYEGAPQPLKSLAGRGYRGLPPPPPDGGAFSRFPEGAREGGDWGDTRIKQYQIAAVRESLLAAAQAPLYRERFAALGLNPAKFESLEQLRDYPLLSKQDLVERRESLTNPRFNGSERLYITTGGSSGVPV